LECPQLSVDTRALGTRRSSGPWSVRSASVSQRLEAGLEEAQVARLVGHRQASRLLPRRVHRLDRLGDDVHVRLRVDAARDRQPCQLELRVVVAARLRVAPGRDDAALERARDLVQRDFSASRQHQKWVADITYVRT